MAATTDFILDIYIVGVLIFLKEEHENNIHSNYKQYIYVMFVLFLYHEAIHVSTTNSTLYYNTQIHQQ